MLRVQGLGDQIVELFGFWDYQDTRLRVSANTASCRYELLGSKNMGLQMSLWHIVMLRRDQAPILSACRGWNVFCYIPSTYPKTFLTCACYFKSCSSHPSSNLSLNIDEKTCPCCPTSIFSKRNTSLLFGASPVRKLPSVPFFPEPNNLWVPQTLLPAVNIQKNISFV